MSDSLVVHAHMHSRRTGVTTHVESVMPGLLEVMEVGWVGDTIQSDVPRMSWPAVRRRARLAPVALHVHRNKEMLAGLLLRAMGAELRIVYTRHSAGTPGRLTRWLMRRADVVVSLTREMARRLPVESVVIPHGVDLRRFSPVRDREAAWAALGFGGELGMGVVGRVRPDKGQGDLVEAAAPILSAHPRWRLLVVGSTKGERRFASKLSDAAGPSLCLAGERSDMERVYRGLSVVVHPSRSEGFGLVLLEAIASGCCVVAARSGGAAEIIRDGETGFLFEPGDVPALRAVLEKLMADPDLADEVGRRAAREAAARFSSVAEMGALARIYGELLGKDVRGRRE